MYKALHAVARHTALHLIITPAGEQLKVICMPKPTGAGADNAALQKPFSITGTPEELETAFPEALAKYSEAVNGLRSALDLPLDALDAEKKKLAKKEEKKAQKEREEKEAAEKRSAAAKAAAETRAANAAKAQAEKERKEKERAEARAQSKTVKTGAKSSGAPLGLPGATSGKTAAAWPFPVGPHAATPPAPAETADTVKHDPKLPGKEECIRQYQQLKLKLGDKKKLTRRLFIKKAESGRRYEKLWPNWEKFVKAAEAQTELSLEPAAEPKRTIPIVPVSEAASDEQAEEHVRCDGCNHNVYSAPSGQPPLKPYPHSRCKHLDMDVPMIVGEQDKWIRSLIPAGCPMHEASRPVRGLSPDKHTDVWDESGEYLGSITTKPEVGKEIDVGRGPMRITAIDARRSGGLDVTVTDNKSEAPPGAGTPDVRSRPDAEAPAPAVAPETKPTYGVYEGDSDRLLKVSRYPFQVGEKIEVEGENCPFKIDSLDPADPRRYRARKVLPFPMRIATEKGERLGETEEIYVPGDKLPIKPGDYQVGRVTLDAYVVRDMSKPRWTVFGLTGDELGSIDVEPKVGEKIDVGAVTGLTVIEVDGNECTAAMVKPRAKGAAPAPATTGEPNA